MKDVVRVDRSMSASIARVFPFPGRKTVWMELGSNKVEALANRNLVRSRSTRPTLMLNFGGASSRSSSIACSVGTLACAPIDEETRFSYQVLQKVSMVKRRSGVEE